MQSKLVESEMSVHYIFAKKVQIIKHGKVKRGLFGVTFTDFVIALPTPIDTYIICNHLRTLYKIRPGKTVTLTNSEIMCDWPAPEEWGQRT